MILQHCLRDLPVLVVDCQATGANPARGAHPIEIGWAQTTAACNEAEVTSRLVALPDDAPLPRRVALMTGISAADVAGGVAAEAVWTELTRAARAVGGAGPTPTVIHYARYERPFLEHLHNGDSPFPLAIICTHEIARRILPGLPRRGLRALTGYFGMSVAELRRAAEHVTATAFVWQKLVAMLSDHYGIRRFEELAEWLEKPPPRPPRRKNFPMARSQRLELPDAPGVYRMLRKNGDLLYIGKATSLKKRVNSYFQKQSKVGDRTLEMLTQARDLDVTVTDSALAAALLESDEIKARCPPYNVALQSRARALAFCRPDLTDFAPEPSPQRRVGPLSAGDSVAAAAKICALLTMASTPASYAELGELIGTSSSPEHDCLVAGIDGFTASHADLFASLSPQRALMRVGARLWSNEHSSSAATAATGWTPERVADHLAAIIRGAAQQVRRGQWLCRLSESALIWTSRERGHGLILSGGQVSAHLPGAVGPPPLSPTWERSPTRRRARFTVKSYDRLRVLTTELRRLVAENAPLGLRLAPRQLIDNARLRQTLQWF